MIQVHGPESDGVGGRGGTKRPDGTRRPKRRFVLLSVIAGMLVVLVGCMTIEQIAPPVSEGILASAREKGFEPTQIEQGRSIYLNECIDCHGPRPVTDYTVSQWISIIAEMAPKSKLDAEQTEDVKAYVLVAREWALSQQVQQAKQPQHEQQQQTGASSMN